MRLNMPHRSTAEAAPPSSAPAVTDASHSATCAAEDTFESVPARHAANALSPRAETVSLPTAQAPQVTAPSDRDRIRAQADALMGRMGALVRDHITSMTCVQIHRLKGLLLEVMRTSLQGQKGELTGVQAYAQLADHTLAFETLWQQPLTQRTADDAAWPALPVGPETLACVRLKAMLLQTLQKAASAEARVQARDGDAAAQALCTQLLSSRIVLAFVYDSTRLLFVSTAQNPEGTAARQTQMAGLFGALAVINTELAHFAPDENPSLGHQVSVVGLDAAMSWPERLKVLDTTLISLKCALERTADSHQILAMTQDTFTRLVFACKHAHAQGSMDAGALQSVVDDAIIQMHQLILRMDPAPEPPHAAPAA